MKKGGFLRNVLDTIRSNQTSGQSSKTNTGGCANDRAFEFGGQLKPSHFSLCHVARHGFPENPTALAFDPVQKIAAIGTKSGAIRVFGRPGVDVCAQHEPAFAVTHIKFVINQGAIITITADDSIHLWSLRGRNLKLQFSTGPTNSPQANSPAPTPASNISSISPQSGSSMAAGGIGGGGNVISSTTSPSSFLGQISDTVSGAVDSASDFLSGGTPLNDHQTSPSPIVDSRHLASRQPELLHTLKFQREHITCLHQTLNSKWLFIGTERGNVHVVNTETLELSGYSIAWNKAIELSRKAHPGSIIHISECPQDTNKLLIGYESGCIVLWDLKQRNADGRYYHTENLLWLAWHYEGKQFVAAHGDGSLITWQTRSNARPSQIVYPHSKTASSASSAQQEFDGSSIGQQQQQQTSLTSSLARSLNNELYRPINKVEWKTSKANNEQFYLFSGGLPYDGYEQVLTQSAQLDSNKPTSSAARGLSTQTVLQQQQQQQRQFLKATSATPGAASPLSSSSPLSGWQQESNDGSKLSSVEHKQATAQRKKKSLRSTSLTVMCGKSITVLEMDDTIIDFTTICDNSPYENDTSDPYAVVVLLSNELILIDLTSSGYPSFDSPYPSASLNESPVTCVQYLADCSSDLIPFLYSTSQNVVSRAPKKGFSDKEWPINGGEWGQSMQSYPELVITGHADGTIKFWDMSGVNFDLISKIKTSKLFERPNKPTNAILISINNQNGGTTRRQQGPKSVGVTTSGEYDSTSSNDSTTLQYCQQVLDENIFAIEKIEFCSVTKRLLVAGACAQVIQFKLNKKETSHTSAANAVTTASDFTTIFVEPLYSVEDQSSSSSSSTTFNQHQWKEHILFKVRNPQNSAAAAASSSSSGSSSSSNSHRGRGMNGFQPELVCLTPLLINTTPSDDYSIISAGGAPQSTSSSTLDQHMANSTNIPYYCRIPPKITAMTFQATHNILAYAHESGIVLVDVVQKCTILNATLSDLYGGSPTSTNSRDISIQPFATSSILQHHYQATSAAAAKTAFGSGSDFSSNTNNSKQYDNNGQHRQTDTVDNEQATTDSGGGKVSNDVVGQFSPTNSFGNITGEEGSSTKKQHSSSGPYMFEFVGGGGVPSSSSSNRTETFVNTLFPDKFDHKNHKQSNQISSSSSFNQLFCSTKNNGPQTTSSNACKNDVPQTHQQTTTTSANNSSASFTGFQASSTSSASPYQSHPSHGQSSSSTHQTRITSASSSAAATTAATSTTTTTTTNNTITNGKDKHNQLTNRCLFTLAPHFALPTTTHARSTACKPLTQHAATIYPYNYIFAYKTPTTYSPQLCAAYLRPAHVASIVVVVVVAVSWFAISPTRRNQPQMVQQQQQQAPIQSRYTNSMFQRQLSTTALVNSPSSSSSSSANNSAHSAAGQQHNTSTKSAAAGAGRLFQRQMTATQLFSGSTNTTSGVACQQSDAAKKRLLANARGDSNLASSAVCLSLSPGSSSSMSTNQQHHHTTNTQQSSLTRPASAVSGTGATGGSATSLADTTANTAKAKSKNKRIISRMLSISVIHTTVGSGGANNLTGGGGGGFNDNAAGCLTNQVGMQQTGVSNDNTMAAAAAASIANESSGGGGGGDQRADKFDSSFRRSRSSSTSSTTGISAQQQAQHESRSTTTNTHSQQQQHESIQCLAFLDNTTQVGTISGNLLAASAGSTTSQQQQHVASAMPSSTASVASSGMSSPTTSGGGGGNTNHKSLSSIADTQTHLALWLGTSSGSVLLVSLQMPDNEDNRVLQLQSITAKPMPQASGKLSGQVLCLAQFVCEARNTQLAPSSVGAHLTGGGAQASSQSSSIEGDTLMQSPCSSGSSASGHTAAGGGGGNATSSMSSGFGGSSSGQLGPSGGMTSKSSIAHDSQASSVSFDSRSSQFFVVVSEKQARVYQVPLVGPQKIDQHHQHTSSGASNSSQPPSSTNDSTTMALFNLMLNNSKRNHLVAECDLSDSSYACCSAVVQMRQPDEACLVSYMATGNVLVHSLPRLKPILMDADFVPYTSGRISSSMRFSRNGHCLYQPSVCEISKFTISSQYKTLVNDMIGLVHVPREMPEMPRTNFFKSLFSVSSSARQSDRDELFSECSAGKPARGVAKHTGAISTSAAAAAGSSSTASLDKLKSAAVGTMGHDMRIAREGLDERGEKLSEIEDRTLQMMNQSESYAQAAHQLAQKFKDKKWYQF